METFNFISLQNYIPYRMDQNVMKGSDAVFVKASSTMPGTM